MTVSTVRPLHRKEPKKAWRLNPSLGRRLAYLGFTLTLGLSAIAVGAAQPPPQTDLSRLDVEDLMNIKVTSVSKREQSLSRTAAAVFVINQEDIRRSGATNIPDLLRMAPGVDVEQIDNNAWAISIRGFNARYSNKVLVLIDGRTVYTPSFSGVFWEHLDMPLENIDRIEVIRGPGATVWGANAVNGVISIFTKSSKDTKGGLVTAGGGSQVYGAGLVQYGGTAGQDGAYRAFGKYFDIGNSAMANGSPAADHWMREHADSGPTAIFPAATPLWWKATCLPTRRARHGGTALFRRHSITSTIKAWTQPAETCWRAGTIRLPADRRPRSRRISIPIDAPIWACRR